MTTNLAVYLTFWFRLLFQLVVDKILVGKGREIGLILVDPVIEKLKSSGTTLFD